MSELEFNEALSREISEEEDDFSCKAFADYLMLHANRLHQLSVYKAYAQIKARADNRYTRGRRQARIVDIAVMTAGVIGFAVAAWFLFSTGAA